MSSDAFPSDAAADPADGAAVIHPVTPEMMDEAAHRAAQLADDVAHHAVPAPERPAEAVEIHNLAAERDGDVVADDLRSTTGPDPVAAAPTQGGDPGLPRGAEALGRYNAALLGMVQANLTATGELFTALIQARTLPEVVAINTDHMRRQFETLAAQGRDLTTLTQTLTFAALNPLTIRRDT